MNQNSAVQDYLKEALYCARNDKPGSVADLVRDAHFEASDNVFTSIADFAMEAYKPILPVLLERLYSTETLEDKNEFSRYKKSIDDYMSMTGIRSIDEVKKSVGFDDPKSSTRYDRV